ncbi:MAG TPA: CoA-binding protein [Candidatus Tumulicola sp.]|jgi:hypothetical protein
MIARTPAQRRALLDRVRSIAVVGASANPLRPSYTVFSYLRTQTAFEITPINPAIAAIDGVAAYPSLAAYARERGAPDLVVVFRRIAELPAVVAETVASGAKAIWFQYGLVDAGAIAAAEAGGLDVVVDRCVKVEHARFSGALATGGLNSGLITSRRRA